MSRYMYMLDHSPVVLHPSNSRHSNRVSNIYQTSCMTQIVVGVFTNHLHSTTTGTQAMARPPRVGQHTAGAPGQVATRAYGGSGGSPAISPEILGPRGAVPLGWTERRTLGGEWRRAAHSPCSEPVSGVSPRAERSAQQVITLSRT